MTNADKFKHLFGIYATELWAMPESDFLEWLNADAQDMPTAERKTGKWQVTDAYPHNVYCSECHKKFAQTHWAVWEDGSLPRNYCPNCGSYNGG